MATELYVPGRGPDRDPNPAEIEYASNFAALGRAIDACDNGEDVALLLSTCRNQWMAANAAFYDLRLVVGAIGKEERITSAIVGIRMGDWRRAESELRDAGLELAQAGEKLRVWEKREQLRGQLDQAIEGLDPNDAFRVRSYLAGQADVRGTVPGRSDSEFLALNTVETPEGAAVLATVRRALEQAAAMTSALTHVARLARARSESEGALFDATGTDDAWERLVDALTKADRGAQSSAEILGIRDGLDRGSPEDARREMTAAILATSEETLDRVRERLAEELRPNVAKPPLPEPYVLDFTGPAPRLADRETEFKVEPGRGRTRPIPNETRVALAAFAVPESIYESADVYRYRRDSNAVGVARRLAVAAVEQAVAAGAQVLALPECFLPTDAREELSELADQHGLTLLAGIEHRVDHDGRVVNEVAVVLPQGPPAAQRKQRPSVYEARQPTFATDYRLTAFENTPLGTLGVVVCSDYLELDLVWSLAKHEPRLDALVICSRNPNPEVFERLAAADAARLFSSVFVVNSDPGSEATGKQPSGEGTVVFLPKRTGQQLAPADRVTLDGEGWEAEGLPTPELLLFDVPVAAVRSRFKGRTDRDYLPAPNFARIRAET